MGKILPVVIVACLPWSSDSGGGQHGEAVIAIHLSSDVHVKDGCGVPTPPCDSLLHTSGEAQSTNYFAYVLVAKADPTLGIGGASFGIHHGQSLGLFGWNRCAPSGTSNEEWERSRSAISVTWDSTRCQRSQPGRPSNGSIACVGFFYLAAYSPSHLSITPHPLNGKAVVLDCSGDTTVVATRSDSSSLRLGTVSFGPRDSSYNPCGPIPRKRP